MEIILPQKVRDYFKRVKEKTKKNILLESIHPSMFAPGMTAAFSYNTNNIIIAIVPDVFKKGITDDLCRSLIHEATHGLLLFGEGYYTIKPKNVTNLSKEEIELRNRLATMINDIVVNYKVQQEGFPAFGENYIPMIRKEIKYINQGKDIYAANLQIGNIYYSKFKISRYIMAWAFLKFFELEDDVKLLLNRYLTCFRNNFLEEYNECKEITNLLNKYDILNPKEHKIVIARISEMWELDAKTEIVKLE